MPLPSRQDLLFPLLDVLGDAHEHTIRDLSDALGDAFRLTDAERHETLSGGRFRFDNLIYWGLHDLKAAGLIARVGHGRYAITSKGVRVIDSGVTDLDYDFLAPFYEEQRLAGEQPPTDLYPAGAQTPEDSLDVVTAGLREALAHNLLETVKSCSPRFFERLVIDLLLAMGYGRDRAGAGRAIGQTGDGGIDGIIEEDKLGLEVLYVQAKRWERTVGRPDVQAFAGSLDGRRARKGVFITTSAFSREAHDYVERIDKRIILIDGERLASLMIDHNVGVTIKQTYVIKDLDETYFEGAL